MSKFIAAICLCLIGTSAIACDMCSIYLGITPNDFQHTAGMHYRGRMLRGTLPVVVPKATPKHAAHIITDSYNGEEIKELYNVYELRGRYFINQKWHLLASVPVVNNYRSIGGATQQDVYGVSDPLLFSNYQLYNTVCNKPDAEDLLIQRLIVGGGMKFPVGDDELRYNDEVVDNDFQPGTGTFDFLANVEYMLKYKRFGANMNLIGKYNSTNKTKDFRFGNTLNGNFNLFYMQPFKGLKLMPATGVNYEMAMKDRDAGYLLQDSGGEVLFWSTGINIFWKRFNLRGHYQMPIKDNLNGDQLSNIDRIILGLTYNFSKKK